jgi:restriction endonuclease S subunit
MMFLEKFDNLKWFELSMLFDIKKGKRLTKADMTEGEIPFIGSIDSNNGYREFIGQKPIHKGNTITVNYNGSVAEAFYQPKPFWASDDINVLYPKFLLNPYIAFFIITIIKHEKYRFNYGRKWHVDRMNRSKVLLPANTNNDPDWKNIERFIKSLNVFKKYKITDSAYFRKPFKYNSADLHLTTNGWTRFDLMGLFRITGTKTTSSPDLEKYGKGKYPYVTTQATSNGIDGFYNYYTENGEVITSDSAVVGYCAYQPLAFSASDHVEKLIPKFKMNKYIALFLVTILNQEQYRFNYGRKCSQTRMKKMQIKLPSKNGNPDWQFMEDYIKTLPYSSSV